MSSNVARVAGRHFLQIPGPTPVPDRILRAIDMPTIDHRGPEFRKLGRARAGGHEVRSSRPPNPVIIYPASGTGAWEAALVNMLSPGDKVLMFETGHFATLWKNMALRLGLDAEFLAWRLARRRRRRRDRGAAARRQGACDQGGLRRPQRDLDRLHLAHRRSAPGDRRRRPPGAAAWSTRSPRSASIDYRHDEWGVDVTVAGSQKGLMLPPGLSFNARLATRRSRPRKPRRMPKLLLVAGRRCCRTTPAASSPTRRRPICSTAWPRPSTCCTRKGWRTCSPATTAMPRRHAAPCAPGAWRCSAATRNTIRPR